MVPGWYVSKSSPACGSDCHCEPVSSSTLTADFNQIVLIDNHLSSAGFLVQKRIPERQPVDFSSFCSVLMAGLTLSCSMVLMALCVNQTVRRHDAVKTSCWRISDRRFPGPVVIAHICISLTVVVESLFFSDIYRHTSVACALAFARSPQSPPVSSWGLMRAPASHRTSLRLVKFVPDEFVAHCRFPAANYFGYSSDRR